MRRFIGMGAALSILTLLAPQAPAAVHLWNLQELYSDSSGTLQFIEMHDPFGGQNFTSGAQIVIFNPTFTESHVYTIPSGTDLPGNTFNQTLLFGTALIEDFGAPTPDYIIPDNFLFKEGGTIFFFGANSGSYTALPLDGVLSRTWGGGDAINSPKNYSGVSGMVVIPEPALFAPIAASLSALGCVLRLRRRTGTP